MKYFKSEEVFYHLEIEKRNKKFQDQFENTKFLDLSKEK